MRVEQLCLAADAAHCKFVPKHDWLVELTSSSLVGIVDIGGLYNCLIGIYEGKADPEILDKWSEFRRKKYQEIVDPISQDNIRRLFDQDPDKAMENDGFLKMLKENEGNVEAPGVPTIIHGFEV